MQHDLDVDLLKCQMDILNLFNTHAMICMLIFSVEISFGLSEMSMHIRLKQIPLLVRLAIRPKHGREEGQRICLHKFVAYAKAKISENSEN